MRILGIDPGSNATGWGAVDCRGIEAELVEAGVIKLPARAPFADRLARLHDALTEVVETLRPDCGAVEAPYHGLNARSALQLAHARGVALAVLGRATVEVVEYAPASVKKAVTGNGRADKRQVRVMVRGMLQGATLAPGDDLSDALAVALCHASHRAFDAALQGRR